MGTMDDMALSPLEIRDSWLHAKPVPFWLDRVCRPGPRPALTSSVNTGLAVVGGGFSGLWTDAAGYTGLGVGASRFGANVMLDLLAGGQTERTELAMVRTKPLPFPPEPLAFMGIQLTRWSLDRADRDQGRRNSWLRALDRLGLGFDS